MRVSDPDSAAEVAPARGEAPVSIERLSALAEDLSEYSPAKYGQLLCAQLLADAQVREFFLRNKTSFESRGLALRVRLLIGPGAPELQALRWELLADPETGHPISLSERFLFSRFMPSRDWRVVTLRPKTAMRAVVAVGLPTNYEAWGLSEIDKEQEVSRALAALTPIPATVIGRDEPLTLDRLIDSIRGGVDILYLVCHGAIRGENKQPCIYIQKEDGTTHAVYASELAQRIGDLQQTPRVVVLASCESAATSDGHPALAPRLAEAGVPAILAMQGQIKQETAAIAMPVFFRELMRDGQIDRAMAAARSAVRGRDDFWMPALFLRLKTGKIWYEPGFGGESEGDTQKWKAICMHIRKGEFIPILGPELGDEIFGGTRELASQLAEQHGFPLEPRDSTDLAKVSQFISANQNRTYALEAVQGQFLKQIMDRMGGAAAGGAAPPTLATLLDQATARNTHDPFRLLAELPAPIYLNAGYTPLMARALRAAGKNPEQIFTDWKSKPTPAGTTETQAASLVPRKPQPANLFPSPEAPWVYQMFGGFARREMMVVTEDDFFDYLIATSRLDLLLPSLVGRLMQSSLLFLGFRLDDWRFRVLFRMIVTSQGNETMKEFPHVGVQINPDEQSLADAERARKYLESYFRGMGAGPQISIFWGTPDDFLNQLRVHLSETNDNVVPVLAENEDDWL